MRPCHGRDLGSIPNQTDFPVVQLVEHYTLAVGDEVRVLAGDLINKRKYMPEPSKIRIIGNFIRANDGVWHNLKSIDTFFVGETKTVEGETPKYEVCFYKARIHAGIIVDNTVSDVHDTKESAEAQMENLLMMLDYGVNK